MTLVEALRGTYAVLGQEISDIALEVLAEDLMLHPLDSVLIALKRCRKELRRLTLADILERIPGGHPGAEQAWAIVSRGIQNEALTMVWTDEMREAYGVAAALVDDPIAARMAFKETYLRLVSESRANNTPIVWSVSQGVDRADRERAILEGVRLGRLTPEYAKRLLPHQDDPQLVKLLESLCPRLLR